MDIEQGPNLGPWLGIAKARILMGPNPKPHGPKF